MGSAVVTIRRAGPDDHERLRELTFASKAHWGYDRDLVRGWTDGLSFEHACDRWIAEAAGELVGWAALTGPQDDCVAVLDHLWVDPARLGQRVGTQLFRLAEERARELGAARLEWGAEPNAVGFYEKVGGRFLRDHVSAWGRITPWMGLEL